MSIVKYSYKKDGNNKLSEHFSVKEFRSNANGVLTTDDILINNELIEKLELLFRVLGATKCIVTSGYRDVKCDKLVGGSGKGQHVEGNAADCKFYIGNKTIDPKLISCKAQDIGFNGIARISNTAIHLDVRKGRKYYGDETVSLNTVTDDFYKYYNIEEKNQNIEKVCKKFGLDNSFWQKNYYTDLGRDCIRDLFDKIAPQIK